MPVFYATQQGATIHLTGGRVELKDNGSVMAALPLADIDRVACFGRVSMTPALMAGLLSRGAPVSLHTQSGTCRGHIVPAESDRAVLRMAQWQAVLNAGSTHAIATALVASKVEGAMHLLRQYRHGLAGQRKALRKLRIIQTRLDASASLDALRGHEGAATRSYYGHFRKLLPAAWPFPGRHYHPPQGPVNALLSLAYGLVRAELAGELSALGLDLAAGFLHSVQNGRPSLTLDLLELFRHPVADHFVLAAIRRGQAAPDEFVEDGRGPGSVRLKPAAFKRVIAAYEAHVTAPRAGLPGGAASYRALFRVEAQRLAHALAQGTHYEVLIWN